MVVAERRAFPRHEVSLKAYVHLRIGSESHVVIGFPATIRSISRGGARLEGAPVGDVLPSPGKDGLCPHRASRAQRDGAALPSRLVS